MAPAAAAVAAAAVDGGPQSLPGFIAFDSTKQDMILDLAGVSTLPFDEQSAFYSLRGIITAKNSCMHHPTQPGAYAVHGGYTPLTALCMVHFKGETQADPGILMGVRDWRIANVDKSGTEVCILREPLFKAARQYSSDITHMKLSSVIGFSPIPMGSTPYSVHLGPCLEKLPQFKALGISKPSDVSDYCDRPMEEKISTVKLFAESEINASAEKIPESSRNKFQTAAHAYLNFRADKLTELCNEGSYDASLAERIFSFGDGSDGDTGTTYPDWMKSPEIQALASPSKLVGLTQTSLVGRGRGEGVQATLRFDSIILDGTTPAASPAAAATGASSSAAAGSGAGESDAHDSGLEDGSSEEEQPLVKRRRQPVERFPAGAAEGKKPARRDSKKPAAASKPKGKKGKVGDKAVQPQINLRTGKPYVRGGPYTKKSDTIHGLKAGARNSNPKEKTTAQAANVTVEELATERADAMLVEMQKEKLDKQLADAKAALTKLKSEQEEAEREYQSRMLQAAKETAEQLRAEFQRGLEMGARLVSGGHAAAFPAPH